jgi:hypothetical protein
MPILREVTINEAIGHALWEAHACIGQWAFCACLAMLRKALDLWSADYRDRNGMTFNKGEHDNLYWRLQKIAGANALYRDSIHKIIDGIRLDANDAVHDSFVCSGGHSGTYEGPEIMAIRGPVEELHQLVVNLIRATMPGVVVVYSDASRWRSRPAKRDITVDQPREEPEIPFADLENKLPDLFAEMRKDLKQNPFVREFVLLGKDWVYNYDPNKPVLHYVFEDHLNLRDKLRMLEHYKLVREITYNNVDRFIFSEEFVDYLTKAE